MLSDRVYGILKFFLKQEEFLTTSETPFTFDELIELRNYGYLCESSKAHYEFEGAYPSMRTAFKITEKGKDALIQHRKEKRNNILTWIITGATLLLSLISVVLQLLQGWR